MHGPSIDDFSDWLDQECVASVRGLSVPMTLCKLDPLEGSPRAAGGFRLEFAGPPDPMLEQGIVHIQGPGSAYDIFIVPIARDAAATRYEAVFF